MAVKTFLMALSGMAAGMGDYFLRVLRLVLWPGGWCSGQDREGPLTVEGKLLVGHAVSRSGSEAGGGRRIVSPKLLGGGMSPTALTWAFASSVAKSSGYMLTSANVIMVSGHGRGFSVQKTMRGSVFSQVRVEISTQSYS